ncbi:MAG: Aspartyl/glutamyl-tRNA(Asn/Gln) amidotransferase subunit B [Chlamydiia bacterium]|nr:Aspartyl/glutamyl-tRNA(Asn/Gln) amidotransferase subunit B [Chlamydiia bacterium]
MSQNDYGEWEPVIGLEIHTQLKTRTKLFSPAPNSFGCEPNLNIDCADTGQPGSLPVLNKEAVRHAAMFGLAIDADVQLFSKFDRKSYFYPDCPRNYQITQFDEPILMGGKVPIVVDGEEKVIDVERAHLEDDAGMLKHLADGSVVDYNRAGVGLLEIVSKPTIRSAAEAAAYGMSVKSILEYIGASECNMEEGMLRMDVNVSVRRKGEEALRTKTEIKNMNSFSGMVLAIDAEIKRQIFEYENNPTIPVDEVIKQSTFRFDLATGKTVLMRSKENAADYRYFPEPDLPPLLLTQEFLDGLKKIMPELPKQRYERYLNELGLSAYSADLLVNDKPLADDFEMALRHCSNPVALCNWMTVEFIGRLKEGSAEKQLTISGSGLKPEHVAELVEMIEKKVVTGKIAKKIAGLMVERPGTPPQAIFDQNPDFAPISDTSVIEKMVDEVLAANPQSIEDFKNGKDKAFQFLVGKTMAMCKGKADPALVRDLIKSKI